MTENVVLNDVVDQPGNLSRLMIDDHIYQQIEGALLDYGLLKAIEEAAEDEELDLETAQRLANYEQ